MQQSRQECRSLHKLATDSQQHLSLRESLEFKSQTYSQRQEVMHNTMAYFNRYLTPAQKRNVLVTQQNSQPANSRTRNANQFRFSTHLRTSSLQNILPSQSWKGSPRTGEFATPNSKRLSRDCIYQFMEQQLQRKARHAGTSLKT